MKKIILLILLSIPSLAFSQERIKRLPPSYTKFAIEKKENAQIENKINLQEFIENMYSNSSKYFNEGALPLIESGDFKVILLDKDSNRIVKKSADFKEYTPDDIETLTFEKTKYDKVFGLETWFWGSVIVKLKENIVSE